MMLDWNDYRKQLAVGVKEVQGAKAPLEVVDA